MDNIGDISAVINRIVSDPSFAEMVGRIKGDSSASSEEISRDVSEKLPEVMAMLAPMMQESDEKAGTEPKNNAETENGRGGNVSSEKNGIIQKKYDKTKAEKLMTAIKPYLSKSRCEIIDKCVTVMQLTDVVSAFGGLENLFKSSD